MTKHREMAKDIFCSAVVEYREDRHGLVARYECSMPVGHDSPHADGHGFMWTRLATADGTLR